MKQRLKATRQFLHRRADSPRENFMLLISGFALFMLGLMAVTIAQFIMPVSIEAELIALLGLFLMICGGATALIGFLSLSILHIFRFLDSDDDTPSRH